jgi:ureidoacrylate peracid hydrolase
MLESSAPPHGVSPTHTMGHPERTRRPAGYIRFEPDQEHVLMTTIERYDPQRSALLVVDPYNDFLSPGGKLYERSKETMEANSCLAHMVQVQAAARHAGLHVLFVPHRRWRTGDLETWTYAAPIQVAATKSQVFAHGTWGGEFHPDFQPRPNEIVAQEHWMSSGFANTDLDLHLKRLGVQRAIVIGLRANTCIDSTVRFAAELGYDVTLVSDAIAAFSVDEMRATIEINAPSYASAILSADDLVGMFAAR